MRGAWTKRTRGGLDGDRGGAVADGRGEARSPGRARRFCRSSRALAGLAIVSLLLSEGPPAAATEPESAPPPPAPGVELDRLLKLPDSFNNDQSGRYGGATRLEWLRRFEEARTAIDEAETEVKRIERELDEMANDSASWSVAAPGTSDPQSGPLSFRLREELRSQREEKERLEKELRALEVRADMLGLPADWRGSQPQTGE